MFKKPNRNFRARKNRDSESGDDYGGPGGGDNIESEENAPIILPASTYKKKKKKGSEGPIKATSKLSFGDDENEGTFNDLSPLVKRVSLESLNCNVHIKLDRSKKRPRLAGRINEFKPKFLGKILEALSRLVIGLLIK